MGTRKSCITAKAHPYAGHAFALTAVMHQEGLEPSTYRLEGDCSIRLSYWCMGR